ncbi:nodal modulator 1-like [Gigantopelta aegis]|uniref:nodal modulator 1-like n=1 Tax=Gigantopelta aegis TaxID=1735272 RepID=UPI001B88E708|nr:nodal modulator 1-like [Gigantopelta aegis]
MWTKYIFSFAFLYIFSECPTITADGLLGCGGFVKSDIDINFSLVEVKLYTTHGSIKYATDCAPVTGYYLIPLYDKGQFLLKVEPPKGWSFEPKAVELHVDGTSDPCSLGEDINFKFTGFSIYGKVLSKGQTTGPKDVKVSLTLAGSNSPLYTSVTDESGSYIFSEVLPGEYTIAASHARWKFQNAKTQVQITNENAHLANNLMVAGYDVTGKVSSDGESVKGVNFILFSSTVKAEAIEDCDKSPVKGFTSPEAVRPLCHVTSKSDGTFIYPTLPTGKYFIVPFYKGDYITFDVVPGKLEFEVQHESVKLQKSFQVSGFSVSGRVLDSVKGRGVSKARVMLDGKFQTNTDEQGIYHLENMKTGSYKIRVEVQNIYFDEMLVKITPNTPQLPDIIPSSFNLCGKVAIDRFPEVLGKLPTQRRVIYFPESKKSDAVSITTESDGKFCTKVKPGKYVIKVHIADTEMKAGLRLSPAERVVTVSTQPVLDVIFSQFRAKISGSLLCLEKCRPIDVSLDAVGRSDMKQVIQGKEVENGAVFTFENVLPGKYKASILHDSWCWKNKTIDIEVVDKDLTGVDFLQTGYILKCSVSHEITMNFAHDKKSGSVGSFPLNKGTNRFCLAQPGMYKLTPDSCHKFDKEVYTYNTSNPAVLTLMAIQHLATGSVRTEDKADDIIITIRSSVHDAPTVLDSLTAKQVDSGKDQKADAVKGPFDYNFSYWARTGEKLEISIQSKELLFYPAQLTVTIMGDACPGEVATSQGKRGVFITGEVKPALEGVTITVTANSSAKPTVFTTDSSGKFRIGPLHRDVQYEVTATKDGYQLTREDGPLYNFRAFKLGQVSVQVVDDEKKPLIAVLLSLSGGNQYRSNNLTAADGKMIFMALSPGQYFLRPMMKEYRFEPPSQMLDVQEGSTKQLTIKGSRVAFSCYGKVTSLNGEPEQGLLVEAVGQDGCSMYLEESKTEADGRYRIRGLEPKCVYEVKLKSGEMNTHVERTVPKSRIVMIENKDLVEMNIIAFRRMSQVDVSGNIVTPIEHLPTIKIRLFREDNPDSPIHTISLSKVSFFYLPSLQFDGTKYTLRLETTLSRSAYDYVLPEVEFTANTSYQHFTVRFQPTRKPGEQELSRGSFLILPLTLLTVFLAYNYQKVLPYVSQYMGKVMQSWASGARPQTVSEAPIPEQLDMDDSIIVKKKVKPRKT